MRCNNNSRRNSLSLAGGTIFFNVVLNVSHRNSSRLSETIYFIRYNYISLQSGGTTRVNSHYLSRKKTILTVCSRSRNGAQKTTIPYMNLLHRRSRRITGPRRSTSSQKYSKSNGNGDIWLYIKRRCNEQRRIRNLP